MVPRAVNRSLRPQACAQTDYVPGLQAAWETSRAMRRGPVPSGRTAKRMTPCPPRDEVKRIAEQSATSVSSLCSGRADRVAPDADFRHMVKGWNGRKTGSKARMPRRRGAQGQQSFASGVSSRPPNLSSIFLYRQVDVPQRDDLGGGGPVDVHQPVAADRHCFHLPRLEEYNQSECRLGLIAKAQARYWLVGSSSSNGPSKQDVIKTSGLGDERSGHGPHWPGNARADP